MPARGESVVVHARWYKAMNVPESSARRSAPEVLDMEASLCIARRREAVGVSASIAAHCVAGDAFHITSKSVVALRRPSSRMASARFTPSARAHSPIARPPSDSWPPWQASCRRRACGSRETGSRVAANLEVRPGGERRMGSSGVNEFLGQDKVLPETPLNASSSKHDCSGSGSSRCSAVFCLDPAIDRQADRAEDHR